VGGKALRISPPHTGKDDMPETISHCGTIREGYSAPDEESHMGGIAYLMTTLLLITAVITSHLFALSRP